MSESFGARLRERREQQQISLSTIAEQTKIKLSLLDALERDDVSHWPSGIFRRAFIRAYAHAIGLEPDVVVREFVELYPDPAEVTEPIPAMAAALDNPLTASGTARLRYLVASAVGTIARRRAKPAPEPVANAIPNLGSPSRAVAAPERREPAPLPIQPRPPALPARPDAAEAIVNARETGSAGAGSDRIANSEKPTQTIEAQSFAPPERRDPGVRPPPDNASAAVAVDFADRGPAMEPAQPSAPPDTVDLPALAELCTQLGRLTATTELPAALQEAARLLDASGLVVWMWDPIAMELYPAMAHGYSDHVLAQLPGLPRDANNATAAAFREAQTCVVPGDDDLGSGALVLPLLTSSGCAGVLALEMQKGNEERESVRAAGAIIAAQLAALVGTAATASVEESDRVRSVG